MVPTIRVEILAVLPTIATVNDSPDVAGIAIVYCRTREGSSNQLQRFLAIADLTQDDMDRTAELVAQYSDLALGAGLLASTRSWSAIGVTWSWTARAVISHSPVRRR